MKITKSNKVLTEKPLTGNIKTTVTQITELNSISALAEIVLKNAFNVSNATGIAEKDWKSQQVFALDFDNGVTPEEILKRCRILAFTPNILYTTFSDTPEKRKFRVLFILDKAIQEYKIAKWTQRGLMKLFPECDAACKDLCRMYYPGTSILFESEELNESDWFIQYNHAQVATNERFWDKFTYQNDEDVVRPNKVEKYNWDLAIKEIKILDAFFNQNYRMSYDILFGLITNAQYIYGGENKIFERMNEINRLGGGQYFPDIKRGIEIYPKEYFYSLKSVKRFNYLPKSFINFSPFEEDHEFRNLLEIQFKRGRVERLKENEQISIYDATKLLKDAYKMAKENIPFEIKYSKPDMLTGESVPSVFEKDNLFNLLPENPIYIFKITTGAGKSEAFLKETNALIALPTHRLKEEMSERMKVNHKTTPVTPEFSLMIINQTLNELRESGLFTEAGKIVKSIAKGSCSIAGIKYSVTQDDINKANFYLLENGDCRIDDTTVLTTHTRALNDESFKHDFIIFDEDPLNDLINIDNISLDFTAFDESPYKPFIQNLEHKLRNITCDCIEKMERFSIPTGFQRFAASIGKGKIIKLLKADLLFKDSKNPSVINFCIKKDFPKDKKIFIMSATAPIPIYKKVYGSRVIVIDITNIKPMGVVEQYTKRSFSSSGMINYNTKIYQELFNDVSGTKVITHAKHYGKFKSLTLLDNPKLTTDSKYFMKGHNYYFGNCSGGDNLNGYDVSIVGTPNKPDFVYLFMADIIGLPNSIDTVLHDQLVDWNDFRFRFFTYGDKDLRDIQLSLVEAELLQAAGRSRFLRNKNTTKIFSSLPLKITTTFYEN